MSIRDDMSVLISTCDKFSDLWDTHMQFYRKNWQDNPYSTYMVTDKKTERSFDGVEIIVAEDEMNFPIRIAKALENITTPYVLLTLDDYFIIDSVSTEDMSYYVERMKAEKIDYLSLYDRRSVKEKKFRSKEDLVPIKLDKKYAVTLYPAIWSVEFLKKTVKSNYSPWVYEVSLTMTAREENANCVQSYAGSFTILDVIRKGKLLHKAKKYLEKCNMPITTRETISYWIEFKLYFMDMLSWYLPRPLFRMIKNLFKKLGYEFYSED